MAAPERTALDRYREVWSPPKVAIYTYSINRFL